MFLIFVARIFLQSSLYLYFRGKPRTIKSIRIVFIYPANLRIVYVGRAEVSGLLNISENELSSA